MSSVKIIINGTSGTSGKEARRILSDIFSAKGIDAQISLARSGDRITVIKFLILPQIR